MFELRFYLLLQSLLSRLPWLLLIPLWALLSRDQQAILSLPL